ncbi:MAG: mono/diheme cytochrome c family protein [Bradymonadia bacterium]|jgi:mono/diheme cytochrome c family protein
MIQPIWRPTLLLLTIGLFGCGPGKPVLPGILSRGALPPGDPVAGTRLRHDRDLGRGGFACADCHAVDQPRPSRSLRGATTAEIDWCVERFMRRPALPAQAIADLQAAPTTPPAPLASTGPALYGQQCAHCHADDALDPILGQPWPRDYLRAVIRGTNRPAHPDTLMPPFSPTALDEDALKRLIAHVVSPSAALEMLAPAQVGLSALWMMVGSHQ